MSVDNPTVSIIMAVRNGAATIEHTLQSVFDQTFSDWELVIIDGASTDETLSLLEKHRSKIAVLMSEPDTGIYEAMNKGIDHALGAWLLFLNCDDQLADPEVLNRVFSDFNHTDFDFLYGNELIYNPHDGSEYLFAKQFARLSDFFTGTAMRHQSTFFRRSLFHQLGRYDTSYTIAADREFMIRCFNSKIVRIAYINHTVTRFSRGGAGESSMVVRAREKLRIAQRYFPFPFVLMQKLRLILWHGYDFFSPSATKISDHTTRHIIFFGTFDQWRPRFRLLKAGLESALPGVPLSSCHIPLWDGVEDKSRLRLMALVKRLMVAVIVYPALITRYFFMPRHDIVIVPYMGLLDVMVAGIIARIRGATVIWDAMISLYDTVVSDRHLITPSSPIALLLYRLEWIACRSAHSIFMDTQAHAGYFESLFKLKKGTVQRVYVGAETLFSDIKPQSVTASTAIIEVLFYGQFIPLHGTQTILEAAELVLKQNSRVHWTIIGEGQDARTFDAQIHQRKIATITRHTHLPYHELPAYIARSHIGLGIFGSSPKAHHVIPNKVYQLLMAGKPLITADTPAMRELIPSALPWVALIPPGDSWALAHTILRWANTMPIVEPPSRKSVQVDATVVGRQLAKVIAIAVNDSKKATGTHG